MDWYEKIYQKLLALNPELVNRSKCTVRLGDKSFIFFLYHDYKQAEFAQARDLPSLQSKKIHLFFDTLIKFLIQNNKIVSCVY